MSRQLEAKIEQRQKREHEAVLDAVYGGLEDAVSYAGGDLTGFSVKMGGADVLLILKAVFPAGPQVAFCGGEDLAGSLRKAVKEARGDALRWKEDQWAR